MDEKTYDMIHPEDMSSEEISCIIKYLSEILDNRTRALQTRAIDKFIDALNELIDLEVIVESSDFHTSSLHCRNMVVGFKQLEFYDKSGKPLRNYDNTKSY